MTWKHGKDRKVRVSKQVFSEKDREDDFLLKKHSLLTDEPEAQPPPIQISNRKSAYNPEIFGQQ